MPRRAGIWQRKGRPWWYTTIGQEQIRLSVDRAEAERMFHRLMAKKGEDALDPNPPDAVLFRRLAEDYLHATRGDKVERAFVGQMNCLRDFGNHVGKLMMASDLRPYMVSAWMRKKTTWGPSTQAMQRKTIKAVLNWAVREGHLEENPLKRMSGGNSQRRERFLTPEERKRITEFVSPEFADFLRAIELTGALPFSEMAQVTGDVIDFEASTITLQKHKNRKKTGKPRTIYVADELMELFRRLVELYPTGPIFRGRRGKMWYTGSARKWFSSIREKLGIEAFPYAYRHTYITEAIIRGVPVEMVAALVGNTPQVIHRHYSHVAQDQAAMRSAANKAIAPKS